MGDTRYVEYIGGPLDGQRVEVGPGEDVTGGGYIVVPGHHRRADYEPRPGAPSQWHFRGWVDL